MQGVRYLVMHVNPQTSRAGVEVLNSMSKSQNSINIRGLPDNITTSYIFITYSYIQLFEST